MLSLNRLLARRDLDDWRDEQTLVAARVLNQAAADLIASFAETVKTATWKDGLIGQDAYIRRAVEPKVVEVVEPIARRLLEDANRALAELVDHSASWTREAGVPAGAANGFEGWEDVAVGVGPIVGGAAIAAAVPTLAVTTTGGLLGTGLFATTVVSWPVVVVGGAAAAVAVGTGIINSARLWDKTEAKLSRRISGHVQAMLLRGSPEHSSILDQLAARYAEAAENARRIW